MESAASNAVANDEHEQAQNDRHVVVLSKIPYGVDRTILDNSEETVANHIHLYSPHNIL